jgi:hypothetical protein
MRFVLPACLVALVASASSCVQVESRHVALVIDLTYGGISDCMDAGVDTVRVTSVDADPQFSTQTVRCDTSVTLDGIVPGTFRIRVEGLASGTVVYTDTFEVTVPAAGKEISADLTPIGFVANFIFGVPDTTDPSADGMTCAEAGANSVSVVIDNGTRLVASCHDTGSNRDAAIVPINPGTHTFTWAAYASTDGSGTAIYSNTFKNVAVTLADLTFNMAGVSNSTFEADFLFSDGHGCPHGNVANITFDVTDSAGTAYPGSSLACDGSSPGFIDPSVPAGVYLVTMKAKDSAGGVIAASPVTRVYAPVGKSLVFPVHLN